MITLGMIVRYELSDCVLKRCQSEEDHPAQTLGNWLALQRREHRMR